MNAMTAADYTYYPFATTNNQDFKNLMSVYFDATLHPLLRFNDFIQEGWRIGPENLVNTVGDKPGDTGSKMVFKGVVYNEMKGQMSDSSYIYYIKFQDHMFPDLNNSGGDPQKMTELTYEQLKKFHEDHYHPSNSKIFTYGDIPLTDHLKEINSQFADFERTMPKSYLRRPVDLSKGPREVVVKGPIDPLMPLDMQYKISLSWIMSKSSDLVETFSLEVLSSLLMDGYGSPLYKNLIEAGFGTEWSPNTGHDTSAVVGVFSIGITGVRKENLARIKEIIHNTLRKVHQEGFDDAKVQGFLHQMEISLKNKTAKFGMSLLNRVKPHWFQGINPIECLKWNDIITAFQAKHKMRGYLEGLLEKYLLNGDTLSFTMIPSETYNNELIEEEALRIDKKMTEITKESGKVEAVSKILKIEHDLLQEQSKTSTEDVGCLPSVHIKDIPRKKDPTHVTECKIGKVCVQWRKAPTNGLTYFRAVNIIDNLPTELRELIPLFTDSIFRLGTRDTKMEQLEDILKLKTGGLVTNYFSSPSPLNISSSTEGLAFSGVALDRNVPDMLRLLRKIVLETDFDSPEAENHIRQLLQSSSDGAINAIAAQGSSFAMTAAEVGFSEYFLRKEQVNGLAQLKLITTLANRPIAEGLADVIDKLKKIQQFALSGSSFRCAVICGQESVSQNDLALRNFIDSLPESGSVSNVSKSVTKLNRKVKLFYHLPYQVYYGALSIPTIPLISRDAAPLKILSKLLTHNHLHHEIREKGGAYGGGATVRSLEGVLSFFSYRDPNPLNTISIIRDTAKWALKQNWTERNLQEAKLSVFQNLDAPKSVGSEGLIRFLSGITDEMAQQQRERLLDVTKEQVQEVTEKYLKGRLENQKYGMVLIGENKPWVDNTWDLINLGITSNSEPSINESISSPNLE